MIVALIPALAPPVAPLKLEIEAPESVRSGEIAHVRVLLVNVSKAPVVVVAPSPLNHGLGVRFDGDLWRADKRVATNWTGKWFGQWMSTGTYEPSAFAKIAPGGRIVVEDAKYETEYLSDQRPSRKTEIYSTPHRDLAPGEYTYRAKWSFKPMLSQKDAEVKPGKRTTWSRQQVSPAAKELYRQAWQGELSIGRSVTIRDK